jgi:uncharacterized protein (DUF1697 family)
VAAVAADYEPFRFAGQQVYVNYSHGLGRSKLAEKFSDIVGVSSTVRNIRTLEKVLALCSDTRPLGNVRGASQIGVGRSGD